ncbi:MAG: glutamate--cysteine ligase [Leptospirales bacterium]|nr:glutamate--cysteine ligase [Leptospirales bacterium]
MTHSLRPMRLPSPEIILNEGSLHGLERECQRVSATGALSRNPHPIALGSPLAHPLITTDYGEAQLEFTTAPHHSMQDVLNEVKLAGAFTARHIGDELLWPFSMPPRLPEDEADIDIARYGKSRSGRNREIYRRGLAHRYGRRMQTISGVHYNFSPGLEFWERWHGRTLREQPGTLHSDSLRTLVDESYFHIIRNFTRRAYLLAFLFGASPAADASFVERADPRLQRLDRHTWLGRHATSLRLSDLGYSNRRSPGLHISLNSAREYMQDLCNAVSSPHPAYAAFRNRPDEMLNDFILQNENEYYAPIRPKQPIMENERPLDALNARGVRYLEVRTLDLDPESNGGICIERLSFIQMLLLHALFTESPPLGETEARRCRERMLRVAWEGRRRDLSLVGENGRKSLHDDGLQLCDELLPLAERLDQECGSQDYTESLRLQAAKFRDPELTPSALHARELDASGLCYIDFGLQRARRLMEQLQKRVISESEMQHMQELSARSLEAQALLERQTATDPAPSVAARPAVCGQP